MRIAEESVKCLEVLGKLTRRSVRIVSHPTLQEISASQTSTKFPDIGVWYAGEIKAVVEVKRPGALIVPPEQLTYSAAEMLNLGRKSGDWQAYDVPQPITFI